MLTHEAAYWRQMIECVRQGEWKCPSCGLINPTSEWYCGECRSNVDGKKETD